jgi:hypothetical protein
MLFYLERKVTLPLHIQCCSTLNVKLPYLYKHSMLFHLERKVTLPLHIQCCSTLNAKLPYLYTFNVVLP